MAEYVASAERMQQIGREISLLAEPGWIVLLEGELGAGKTTLVRGVLEGLGFEEPVRSPTFNLIQTFQTTPPLLHADLYRLPVGADIGLSDYFDTHFCLIEWPERCPELLDEPNLIRVQIEFEGDGRRVTIVTGSTIT